MNKHSAVVFRFFSPFTVVLVLSACADISRIDPEDTEFPAAAPLSTGSGVASTRTTVSGQPVRFDTGRDPLDGAVQSQIWRLNQRQRDIAIIPPTDPVPADQIDTLRQQRMHAETLARSGQVPRPVLGARSGRPDFSGPASPGSSALNRSITRARAAEASALTR